MNKHLLEGPRSSESVQTCTRTRVVCVASVIGLLAVSTVAYHGRAGRIDIPLRNSAQKVTFLHQYTSGGEPLSEHESAGKAHTGRASAAEAIEPVWNRSSVISGGELVPSSSLATAEEEERTFRTILGMSAKPPYYYVIGAGAVKPGILMKLFSPPRPDVLKQASVMKHMTTFGVGCLAAAQVATDAHHVVQCATANLTWWERTNCVFFALSISTNIQTTVALYQLAGLYKGSLAWRRAHDIHDYEVADVRQLIIFNQGMPWWIFYNAMLWTYVPVMGALALFCSAGWLCYFWLVAAVMVALVVISAINVGCIENMKSRDVAPVPTKDVEEVIAKLNVDNKKEYLFPVNDGGDELRGKTAGLTYSTNHDSFNRTGVPAASWSMYFVYPVVSLTFAVVCPVATRFYVGAGYWSSISYTWDDRHIAAYTRSLFTTAMGAGIAAKSGWEAFCHRWMQAVNYLI